MAQQGLKKKSDKFSGIPKSQSKGTKHSKPLGPRKGRHYIAPKKAKQQKVAKLKKQLQKQIVQKIEQDVTQKANQVGTNFRILDSSAGSSSSTATSQTADSTKQQKSKKKA